MISVGSMLRFKNHNGPWETALVIRSYRCESKACCWSERSLKLRDGGRVDDYFMSGQVVDILWNTGHIDTDYHLEGLSSDRVEVIPQR